MNTPSFKEDHISQIPALQLLVNMGYRYLSPDEALNQRKSKTTSVLLESILRTRLEKINSITYKGNTFGFTSANIQSAIQALKDLPMQEGYMAASEYVYNLLTLGKSLEQSIDGDKKSYTIKFIDWQRPENNEFHVTEEFSVMRAASSEHYRPDLVLFVNGIPEITNPGGFPLGVRLDNLLTVNSTPRNRLLADVLAKTGAVERSGQGIDKIFYQTISESKPEPDYTKSDDYQVELRLSALVEDKAFALFIKDIQSKRKGSDKLSVQEVIILNSIRKGADHRLLNPVLIQKLESDNLLEKVGKTKAQRFILSKDYYVFSDKKADYSSLKPLDTNQIIVMMVNHLKEFGTAKMGDFEKLLKNFLQRHQVKYLVEQLLEKQIFDKDGKGKGTVYKQGKRIADSEKLFARAFKLGIEEMKKRGEIHGE